MKHIVRHDLFHNPVNGSSTTLPLPIGSVIFHCEYDNTHNNIFIFSLEEKDETKKIYRTFYCFEPLTDIHLFQHAQSYWHIGTIKKHNDFAPGVQPIYFTIWEVKQASNQYILQYGE